MKQPKQLDFYKVILLDSLAERINSLESDEFFALELALNKFVTNFIQNDFGKPTVGPQPNNVINFQKAKLSLQLTKFDKMRR